MTSKFARLYQPMVALAPTPYTPLDDYLASLHNPVWADSGQTSIRLEGVYSGQPTTFLALENDPEPHGQEVYANAIDGAYGPIGAYAPPPPPTKDELNAYASHKAATLLGTSRNYTNPAGSGQISCAVGLEQGNLNQLHLWGVGNSIETTQWTDDTYATFTLTGEQAVQFWNDTTAYQQSVNATLSQVTGGIASGSITSYAQIDAANWPT